jgi:hypothetical protein
VGISSWGICPAGFPFAFIRDASSGLDSGRGLSSSGFSSSIFSSIISFISLFFFPTSSSFPMVLGVSSPIRVGSISNFFAAFINLFCVIPFIFSDSAIINIPLDSSFFIW